MSDVVETTTAVETPVAAKPAKRATKKAAAKKATKKVAKSAKKVAKPVKAKGEKTAADIRWAGYRVKIVRAMQRLQATTAVNSRSAEAIAKTAQLTESNVKHYCGVKQDLVHFGYVAVAKLEDQPVHTYYLTAKGKAFDTKSVE